MSTNRRRFLQTSLASSTLVAMGATTVPEFLGRSARAAVAGKPNERILVVVQLLGGNDGLNTVVPHGIDGYNRGRRALRIGSPQVHKVTDGDRPAPGDGRDEQAAGEGAAEYRPGRGLSQPRPLALPLDGDLGGGPRWRTTPRRWRPAGWAGPSTRRGESRARIRRPCTSAGGSLPQALRSLKTEVPALESLESYKLQLTGSEPERKAERSSLNEMARLAPQGGRPLAGLHPPDDAVGLRVQQPAGAGGAEGRRR